MLSGRATLGEINQALALARRDFGSVDSQMQSGASDLARNQAQQTRILKALAQERLDAIESGRLISSVDTADSLAERMLAEREEALANFTQQFEEGQAALLQAEAQREAVHETVDAAALELAELEAGVQQLLEEDADYQAQLATTHQAREIAAQADDKMKTAEQDRIAKGQPYEANTLFSYLWERNYGTADYNATGIFATLDDWVAGLCDYQSARANYWMLLEIPRRLAEHSRMVGQRAEAELAKLQELETKVANAAGVDIAQQALTAAEAEQDASDAHIDEVEAALAVVQESLTKFAVGEDEFTQRCLHQLAEIYTSRDVTRLESMVDDTLSTRDDSMVDELVDLRAEQALLKDELQESKEVHGQHARRLKDLEDIRRRFKRHRFDDLRSSFGSERVIRLVLNEFLRGAVGSSGVWDTLKREQRYQDVGGAWPDFGSGGLPRGRRGTSPWHWPGGRGGFRMPRRGGSRSRGGAKRGGGFRTGGGF